MSVLKIIKYPNKLLHQKSEEVTTTEFNKKLEKLVNNMFDTISVYDGIGLAGVQVGVLKRVLVIDINSQEQTFKSEVINPKILSFSNDKSVMEEGCLSVSNGTYDVERPNRITVEFTKINGNKIKIDADGLLAKCFQHEIDHLNGITIVDRGTKSK